jgi:hypothetical protein
MVYDDGIEALDYLGELVLTNQFARFAFARHRKRSVRLGECLLQLSPIVSSSACCRPATGLAGYHDGHEMPSVGLMTGLQLIHSLQPAVHIILTIPAATCSVPPAFTLPSSPLLVVTHVTLGRSLHPVHADHNRDHPPPRPTTSDSLASFPRPRTNQGTSTSRG